MQTLTILASIVFATLVSADNCPNPVYKRFSAQHTGCKSPSSTCRFLGTGVTSEDKETVLRVHNQLRQKIASGGEMTGYGFPSAGNMMKLEWDDELAFVAQSHANQCEFAHDCNDCRKVDGFSVGQNLGISFNSDGPNVPKNWTKIIQMFYDEIAFAPPSIVSSYQSKSSYGHFSQVVWADTWKIGCGYAAYRSNQKPQFPIQQLYTCNYGPAGNMLQASMYKKGSPASQCPSNTRRASDFPALCQAVDASGPQASDDKKKSDASLFFCDFARNSVCGLRIWHQNNAFLIPSRGFNYLSFRVSAGQKISFALPQALQSNRGFCVTLTKRKGASDASRQANNLLQMQIVDSASGQKNELMMSGDSVAWIPFSVNLSSFTRKTDIQFSFEVPKGASDQVLDVKEIRVYEGACQ